jgi:YesN/AraC family two-component response regulator
LVAEDGLEAYKLLEKDDFALIISDIKMPKLSGTELLKQAFN